MASGAIIGVRFGFEDARFGFERLRKEQAVSLTQLPMHFRFPGTIGPGRHRPRRAFETAEPKSSDFWPHVALLARIRLDQRQ